MSLYAKYSDLGEKENPNPVESYQVVALQSAEHKAQIIQQHRIVVVDVYGDWCGPCKAIAPKYAQMAKQYGRPQLCILVKEDVDKGFSQNVRGVPLFQFFVNGQFDSSITGADIKGVEEKLIELIQQIPV